MPNPVPATKKGIPILTAVHRATAAQTPGAVQLKQRPRPVPAAQLPVPVTKLPPILTATAVPPGTAFPAQTDIPLPNLKYVPAAQPPEPAISANRQAAANVK